ncbi:15975_t:CDS:2, partial [Acaulospora morrowiae]
MSTSKPKFVKKQIHGYFKRKSSEWNILDFLKECDLEPCTLKLEEYILSLKTISNTEEGQRHEKAQELLNNYMQASLNFFAKTSQDSVGAQMTAKIVWCQDEIRRNGNMAQENGRRSASVNRFNRSSTRPSIGPSITTAGSVPSTVEFFGTDLSERIISKRDREDDDFKEQIEQTTKKEQHQTKCGRKIPNYCELTSSSSEGDDNDEINAFFQSSSEQQSFNPFKKLRKSDEQDIFNEEDNEDDEIKTTKSPSASASSASCVHESQDINENVKSDAKTNLEDTDIDARQTAIPSSFCQTTDIIDAVTNDKNSMHKIHNEPETSSNDYTEELEDDEEEIKFDLTDISIELQREQTVK